MAAAGRLLAALALAAALGCGGAMPVAARQEAIVNGDADSGDPAVMLLAAKNGTAVSLCTAELISPHVLITAAHCVVPTEVGDNAIFYVYRGADLNADPTHLGLLAVQAVMYDPAFSVDPNVFTVEGHDIGVVVLQKPILDVAPLPYQLAALPLELTGQDVRLVGYGVVQGSDKNGTTAGTKRQAQSKLYRIDDKLLRVFDDKHTICQGDSGGPALVKVAGVETVVGLTAFGDMGCPLTAEGSFTRVDLYARDLVVPVVEQYDPTPAAAPHDQPLGAACAHNRECASLQCADGGFCTTSCDPNATNVCPAPLTCGDLDGANFCRHPHGGCSAAPAGAPASFAALGLLGLALAGLTLRRRPSTRLRAG